MLDALSLESYFEQELGKISINEYFHAVTWMRKRTVLVIQSVLHVVDGSIGYRG